MSVIQNNCKSFFDNNYSPHFCEIMYRATNQTLFSSPSLGLVKKGTKVETWPICPSPKFFVPTFKSNRDFYRKTFYKRSIHEWDGGELNSYQPPATSKINQMAKQLGFKGKINISPNAVEECAHFGQLPYVVSDNKLSEMAGCKPFFRDLIGLNGLDLQQEAEGIIAHEIGHFAFNHAGSKNDEIQADLYSLRNGHLGRGLLNGLKRLEKSLPIEVEIALRGSGSPYPYLFERIQYLTEGLCGIYPEQNRDIC